MFLKEWIIIISEKRPKGGMYREDWGWRYGKYIFVGERTRPRTLFVHNCIGKICSPSPCDHDRASELVPLSLFTNIWGIFCRKIACLGVRKCALMGTAARMHVPLSPAAGRRGLWTRAAFWNYPERCKRCPGKHLCRLSLGVSFPARANSQFISFDICI